MKQLRPSTHDFFTRPLRFHLGVVIVLLLATVSAVLIGLNVVRGRNAALTAADEEMRALAGRVIDRLEAMLGDPIAFVSLASAGDLFLSAPPDRLPAKIGFLRKAVEASPHLDAAYVGYRGGEFLLVVSLASSPGWRTSLQAPPDANLAARIIETDGLGRQVSRWRFLDADGLEIRSTGPEIADYNPRLRPWYQPPSTIANRYRPAPM